MVPRPPNRPVFIARPALYGLVDTAPCRGLRGNACSERAMPLVAKRRRRRVPEWSSVKLRRPAAQQAVCPAFATRVQPGNASPHTLLGNDTSHRETKSIGECMLDPNGRPFEREQAHGCQIPLTKVTHARRVAATIIIAPGLDAVALTACASKCGPPAKDFIAKRSSPSHHPAIADPCWLRGIARRFRAGRARSRRSGMESGACHPA